MGLIHAHEMQDKEYGVNEHLGGSVSAKKTVNKISLNKAYQRFDNKSNAVQHVLLFGVLILGYNMLETSGWNTALAAVLVAIVGATLTLHYYLKHQRLADRPMSMRRAASRGFIESQRHLKGQTLTSPMTGQACTFWRLAFTTIDADRVNRDRDLEATVFSKPCVEFSDKTDSCWLRAEEADWQVKTNTESHSKAATLTSKYASLLGKGFLVEWYVQTKLKIIGTATSVSKQLERGDPSQPLAGNQEARVLNQGSEAQDVIEVYAGSKSNELRSLKIKPYMSFAVLVASLSVLTVVGPEQLPIAIDEIKAFFYLTNRFTWR